MQLEFIHGRSVAYIFTFSDAELVLILCNIDHPAPVLFILLFFGVYDSYEIPSGVFNVPANAIRSGIGI